MTSIDYRAKFQALGQDEPSKTLVYGERKSLAYGAENDNILAPLWDTDGLMFPYTPMIQMQHSNVAFGQYDLPHTNYDYMAYSKTQSPSMTVTGTFGAHTEPEARYMIAAIHFFRVVSKSNFGLSDPKRGTPPPKLAFSAYGPAMFNRVPVYIRSVSFGLDQDVDYVPITSGLGETGDGVLDNYLAKSYLPLVLNIFVDAVVSPNPSQLRDEFNLEDFRTGKLLDKGFY